MNQEIIHILTELPLILKQKSKKIMKQRMKRKLHPAMRRNESRRHIVKQMAVGKEEDESLTAAVVVDDSKTPRTFLDSTVSFTLKEKEQITRHQHPNVALLAAQDFERNAAVGNVGEDIEESISRWKRKADQKQEAMAKTEPFGHDDVREFKMWIYGADWDQNM